MIKKIAISEKLKLEIREEKKRFLVQVYISGEPVIVPELFEVALGRFKNWEFGKAGSECKIFNENSITNIIFELEQFKAELRVDA